MSASGYKLPRQMPSAVTVFYAFRLAKKKRSHAPYAFLSNQFQNPASKDGTSYRAMLCNLCAKNYNDGHVRMGNEPVLA